LLGTMGFKREFIIYFISLIEITRLSMWNLIVVEKEHLVNIGEFKAIDEITFPYDLKVPQE
jgi:hypothetical protein